MHADPARTRRVAVSAGSLVTLQMVAMLLPLLTLPVLARALGVELFGKVMLAQFVVFFGVVFVDAGFNVESQRRVAIATDGRAQGQALLDNLIARTLLAFAVSALVLAVGAAMADLPLWMVAVALLHLVGTLAFPQWWLVAREQGLLLGLVSVAGRLVSAGLILYLVKGPQDAWIALACSSSATLLSGVLISPAICRALCFQKLDWQAYRSYMSAVRPMIASGFIASSGQSLPVVLLGGVAGAHQVGLFSAADRLTRAAAHLATILSQSMLSVVARWHRDQPEHACIWDKRVLKVVALVCLCGGGALVAVAAPLMKLIYGIQFVDGVYVLQGLSVWLALYVFRNVWVIVKWTAHGQLGPVARLQWQEGLSIAALSLAGGWVGGALGVTAGLVACEVALLLRIWTRGDFSRRSEQ